MRVTWLAKANHRPFDTEPHAELRLQYQSFWLCELLLQPISRDRILFIPMTLVQQTIKMRMCNIEVMLLALTTSHNVDFVSFDCDYCSNGNDVWMCAVIFCRAFHVVSYCCIQNWVSWKQNSNTDEPRTVVDNSFRYCFFFFYLSFLDNHNCSSLFVTAIALTNCFP